MWDLIVSVPDHCLSFYFPYSSCYIRSCLFDFHFTDFIQYKTSYFLSTIPYEVGVLIVSIENLWSVSVLSLAHTTVKLVSKVAVNMEFVVV